MITYIRQWFSAFNPLFFWPAVMVVAFFAAAFLLPQQISQLTIGLNQFIYQYCGQLYLWFAVAAIVAFLALAASPAGKIRIGGVDSRPEHSFFSWLAMLFCCGMGTGLMLWGAAEPLYHYLSPPVNAELSDKQLAFTMTFLHWGVLPWAIYGLAALMIGFYGFNLKKGFTFSAFLSDNNHLPSSVKNILMDVVDLITIMAIIIGIAATMATGVLSLEGGLHTMFNLPSGLVLQISILTGLTVVYLISAANGLDKGIKVLSNVSILMSILLMVVILCLGPTFAILKGFFINTVNHLLYLPSLSLGFADYADPNWLNDWTIKYWSWWIAWAPFVGLFVAIISKGRTIRELVLAVMLLPTLYSFLWFSVFGQTAIYLYKTGVFTVDTFSWNQVADLLFQLFSYLSSGPLLSWLSLGLVAIFICNSADSASYIMTCFSSRQLHEKAQVHVQVAWGVVFALLTMGLLLMGGDNNSGALFILQQVTQIFALPFMLVLIVVFVQFIKDIFSYKLQ